MAPLAIIYAWVGANYVGYTRKITGGAAVSVAFGIANIIGPQTYQAKDAPGYLPAKITLMAVVASALFATLALRLLYGYRNGVADEKGVGAMSATERYNFEDIPDPDRSPNFRYVY